QDIHWEPKGAFTGAVSGPLVAQAGARATLVGHSERRHVFGETDEDTRKKVAAALAVGLAPVLCVGETLAEREAGHTLAVVTRQLVGALGGLDASKLGQITTAYEPVWAIGTGKNATPRDAAQVHREIRGWLAARGVARARIARRRRRHRAVHGRAAGDDPAHQTHLVVGGDLSVPVARARDHVRADQRPALGDRHDRPAAGSGAAHAAAAAIHAAGAATGPA